MKNYIPLPLSHAVHLNGESLLVKVCRLDGVCLFQQVLLEETGILHGCMVQLDVIPLPKVVSPKAITEQDEMFIAFAKACGAKDDDIDLVDKKFKVSVKLPDGKDIKSGWLSSE